jgi:hypothetical protein
MVDRNRKYNLATELRSWIPVELIWCFRGEAVPFRGSERFATDKSHTRAALPVAITPENGNEFGTDRFNKK